MSEEPKTSKVSTKAEGVQQGTLAGGVVVKQWIIVQEPGMVPEKKSPPRTDEGAIDFLIQLALCRPKGTHYTLAELTWDNDLWVQSGGEALAMCRLAGPRRFARRVRGIAEKEAAWLTTTPDRVKAVAAGSLP